MRTENPNPVMKRLKEWKDMIEQEQVISDKVSSVFGFDNIVIEHMDRMISEYTKAVERELNLQHGTLVDIAWTADGFCYESFNELLDAQ